MAGDNIIMNNVDDEEKSALKNLEAYNIDIHPLVERIYLICKQNEMPGFMLFQDHKNQLRASLANFGQPANDLLMGYLISSFEDKSEPIGPDLDLLINAMITHSQVHGHSSVFLDALGIPR
jgi:hypothetical protein